MAAASANAAEPVRILSGGPAGMKLLEPLKPQMEEAAGVPVEIKVTRFDAAIKGLAAGTIEAMVGPTLVKTLEAGEKVGMAKQNPDDFQSVQIMSNKVWALINPKNPTKNLTKEQLTGILNGTIKSWETINGQKAPIVVVMPKNLEATMKALTMHYLKSETSPIAEYAPTQDGVLKRIEMNPNEIGFSGVGSGTKTFTPTAFTTDARVDLYFLMKKNTRREAQKVFDYLKDNVAKKLKD